MTKTSSCPLCFSDKTTLKLATDKPFKAKYLNCERCQLIFTHPDFLLIQSEEKERYDFHENNYEDIGYRNFLSKLIEPIKNFIDRSKYGLDFGCGPGPVLAKMMREVGYEMDTYDPIYKDDLNNKKYDFITSTEVIEHFHRPRQSFDQIMSLLQDNGVLGVMTSIYSNEIDFKTWHYRNDDTHVAFYSDNTMKWIEEFYGLKPLYKAKNIRIWQKSIS